MPSNERGCRHLEQIENPCQPTVSRHPASPGSPSETCSAGDEAELRRSVCYAARLGPVTSIELPGSSYLGRVTWLESLGWVSFGSGRIAANRNADRHVFGHDTASPDDG